MLSITKARKSLPLVVVIFLVLIVVMLVGFACACLTDHPMQAIEKALSATLVGAAPIAAWPVLAVGLVGAVLTARLSGAARNRASPAVLQRFLF